VKEPGGTEFFLRAEGRRNTAFLVKNILGRKIFSTNVGWGELTLCNISKIKSTRII
jgi:hypothetical protein